MTDNRKIEEEMREMQNEAAEEQKELSVEESFEALDAMLAKMESENATLEETFELYQKGMKLLKGVHSRLDDYEKKMQILTSDGVLEDFE